MLAPLFQNLPTAVLAAIVISSVVGLVDLGELRRYYRWKRTDFLLAMTALIGVVSTTALTGMAIAVALSLLAILYQASRPYIAVLGRIPGSPPVFADADRHPTAEPVEGFLLLRPNVPLTFVNADVAKDHVIALVRARAAGTRAVVLDIGATADLDVATTDMLMGLASELARRRRRAPARPGSRLRPRPDAQDRAGRHDRRGALVPVGRGWRSRRPSLRRRGTDRGTGAARGRARDRLAESRVRPDGEPGHDDDRDHRQGEKEDVAGRLCDPRGGGTRTRTARPPVLGSPARCHSEDIVGTPVGGTSAPIHSPAASPPRCAALSMVPPDANPNTMLITTRNISWLTIPRLCRSTGWWMRAAVNRMPNSPKIAPGRPDRRDVATEHEARDRARGGAGQVEEQEPDRPVPALDDRAREVERVHVEAEVEQVAVEQGHGPQPPVLPRRHGGLVELEKVVDRLAGRWLGEQRGQRDDARDRDDHEGHRDPRRVAAAAREVALRGAGVAGLLVEPAEAAGDLGLVLGRRPAVRLAVGGDRAVQVAVADARGRDVPPRRVGRRRLGQLEDGRPARRPPAASSSSR